MDSTMYDVMDGVFIGGLLFCVFMIIAAVVYVKGLELLEWALDKFWEYQDLKKRNKHRVKSGLPKLKNLNNE